MGTFKDFLFFFQIQKPYNMKKQSNTWSEYKKRNTVKVLIVCLPNGMLVYASKPYEGSISDRQIIIDSGFLEMLDEGDVVLGNIFLIIIANLFINFFIR